MATGETAGDLFSSFLQVMNTITILISTMIFNNPEIISLFMITSYVLASFNNKGHATTIFQFFGGGKVKYKC